MARYGSLITEVIYPFARGSLTSTGSNYGTSVSTAGSTSFIEVEEVAVTIPDNAQIIELEIGLTIGLTIGAATTDSPKVTYNIKDSTQTSYDVLVAVTSTSIGAIASTTNFVDDTRAGFITPSDGTYFTGKSFDLQATIASDASTSNVQGKMKNSSYVRYSYYLVG